jgi:hypothetical protein
MTWENCSISLQNIVSFLELHPKEVNRKNKSNAIRTETLIIVLCVEINTGNTHYVSLWGEKELIISAILRIKLCQLN